MEWTCLVWISFCPGRSNLEVLMNRSCGESWSNLIHNDEEHFLLPGLLLR